LKRFLIPILQTLGYLLLVLVVTMVLMGLAKTFIGDWGSGDPRLDVLGEGAFSVRLSLERCDLREVAFRLRGVFTSPGTECRGSPARRYRERSSACPA
jgi:hypothetical protein